MRRPTATTDTAPRPGSSAAPPGRVLIVLHEDTLGGASRALLRPLELLTERGWEVSFWCTRPSPIFDELVERGHAVEGAPRLMRYRLRSLRDAPGVRARVGSLGSSLAAFRRHLRALQPDFVHVNGRLALPEGLVARASGFPVVAYMHDPGLSGLRGQLGRLGPWIAAQEVIAVSPGHAETMRVRGRAPRVVFPSAPLPDAPPKREPRDGPPVVGTIGLLIPIKGTDLFVDMAERLRAQDVEVEFRVAGGTETSYTRDWALAQMARGEPLGIKWLGHVDVARELAEWDVMVMPSRADSFPLSVLEAMAAGVPVVGTNVGGIPEQLAGGAGLLVPPDDPDALAEAVATLLRDRAAREVLGAAGARRVRQRFTVAHAADALEAAWLAVLGRGRVA